MSKMVDTQVEKAQSLVNGVRNHIDGLRKYGFTEEKMNALEMELTKLKGYSSELDELKRQEKEKRDQVNSTLAMLKEEYREMKLPIKNNMPNYDWHFFGIMDKQ